jgi:four helix bundle protein
MEQGAWSQGDHMAQFRFQNLEIWKRAIDIAGEMDERKFYRFSDQLRGAALSISNNIAEGSGSASKKD